MTLQDRSDRGTETSIATSGGAPSAKTSGNVAVTIAMADYDRTRPFMDGRVRFAGIDAQIFNEHVGNFCKRPVYEEFDIAEMSLSWFVAARSRGEAVIGYPIFPLRMPVFAYMFCLADAPYERPSDLMGKRVGTPGYRYTVNLWLRGLLKEHYGLSPQQVTWVTGEPEGAGYKIPSDIRWELNAASGAEDLLLNGKIDAIFSPNAPASVKSCDGRIRRLFPDAAGEQAGLFKKTGILPITHVMVVGEKFAEENPWAAASLMEGFRMAQRITDEYNAEPKNMSSPEGMYMVESTRRAYGANLWTHGLAANRRNLETFLDYAHEQGYVTSRPILESLFAANTLAL